MSRHRRQAAAADCRDAAPLRLDSTPRLRIVGGSDQMLLTRANLKRKRALAGFRQELDSIEASPDLGTQAKPVESARCEHNRIEPALTALAQTRVDISAQRLDR